MKTILSAILLVTSILALTVVITVSSLLDPLHIVGGPTP